MHHVTDFFGILNLEQNKGVPGYIVTTSDYFPAAYQAAKDSGGRVRLINGKRLLRYITYVGGSRTDGHFAGQPVAPPAPIAPTIVTDGEAVWVERTRHPRQASILAIANNKGGVAKTTTALDLAFALSQHHDQRVLLIDLDAQASLTKSLPPPLPLEAPAGSPTPQDTAFVSDYFRGKATLAQLVRPTQFRHLAVIPADAQLLRLDTGGFARPHAEVQFARDLDQLAREVEHEGGKFDWIILDTPPAQSFWTRMAVGAADRVLIPAWAEMYGTQGVDGALETIRTMHALYHEVTNWKVRVYGCLITKWKPSRTANLAMANLRTHLDTQGIKVLGFAIPHDDRVEQGHQDTIGGGKRGLFGIARQPGPAAQAYDRLAEEMMTYAKSRLK
jgi:chromosome partitioning protein